VTFDGNVKVLVSANYMRNPNPLQEDRGIHTRAGYTREELFPPLRGQTVSRYRLWVDNPGKLWNNPTWETFQHDGPGRLASIIQTVMQNNSWQPEHGEVL